MISDMIGQGRAREITVNVALPFSFAWTEAASQQKLSQHIVEVYRTYPRLEENQITRYLNNLLWGKGKPKVINSAQRQQGLIHLYKTFCQDQRCDACTVNASN